MELSINSRKIGKKVTFSQAGANYIYIDLNDQPGTLGKQICDGGSFSGSTIGCANGDQAVFDRICWKWWEKYLVRLNA